MARTDIIHKETAPGSCCCDWLYNWYVLFRVIVSAGQGSQSLYQLGCHQNFGPGNFGPPDMVHGPS